MVIKTLLYMFICTRGTVNVFDKTKNPVLPIKKSFLYAKKRKKENTLLFTCRSVQKGGCKQL